MTWTNKNMFICRKQTHRKCISQQVADIQPPASTCWVIFFLVLSYTNVNLKPKENAQKNAPQKRILQFRHFYMWRWSETDSSSSSTTTRAVKFCVSSSSFLHLVSTANHLPPSCSLILCCLFSTLLLLQAFCLPGPTSVSFCWYPHSSSPGHVLTISDWLHLEKHLTCLWCLLSPDPCWSYLNYTISLHIQVSW